MIAQYRIIDATQIGTLESQLRYSPQNVRSFAGIGPSPANRVCGPFYCSTEATERHLTGLGSLASLGSATSGHGLTTRANLEGYLHPTVAAGAFCRHDHARLTRTSVLARHRDGMRLDD